MGRLPVISEDLDAGTFVFCMSSHRANWPTGLTDTSLVLLGRNISTPSVFNSSRCSSIHIQTQYTGLPNVDRPLTAISTSPPSQQCQESSNLKRQLSERYSHMRRTQVLEPCKVLGFKSGSSLRRGSSYEHVDLQNLIEFLMYHDCLICSCLGRAAQECSSQRRGTWLT